ncbi:LCP family protein [Candidatus Saccharibacteria bacterium]|nr:LCP family protein [Candidatus Saccharibacteria bacterium]
MVEKKKVVRKSAQKPAKKPVTKKQPRKKAESEILLSRNNYTEMALISLQAFASLLIVVSLARMGILNGWYILLIAGVLTGALAFTIIQLVCKETNKKSKAKKKLKKGKKTKQWAKISATIISVLVTIISLAAFHYTNSFNTLLDKISVGDYSATSEDLAEKSFIVYISGSDAREGIKETARSDVNILAVVNPRESKILLVSIPRDTYVRLHDTTGLKDKLTHAGLYGVEMSKATIEDFLGIKIDRTIKVSFDTVVGVVDELGGIEINSDAEMNLKVEGEEKYCYFSVGTQQVDGDCALRFSRERKTYGTGDLHRGENQQQVLTAILTKLAGDKGYLLKLPSILDIVANSFETTFLREEITALVRWQLETGTNWQIESLMVKGKSDMLPTYTYGEGMPLYVMHADAESITEVQNKIAEYFAS